MGYSRLPVRIFLIEPVLLLNTFGSTGSQGFPVYFTRNDVKSAIHAPLDANWTECSNINVFPQGDGSTPSALSVLPNVIEKSVRSVIAHGLADYILMTEG